MNFLRDVLDMIGLKVENGRPAPNMPQVETAAAISHQFERDAEALKRRHEIDMRGDPRIPTNAETLGFVRETRIGRVDTHLR